MKKIITSLGMISFGYLGTICARGLAVFINHSSKLFSADIATLFYGLIGSYLFLFLVLKINIKVSLTSFIVSLTPLDILQYLNKNLNLNFISWFVVSIIIIVLFLVWIFQIYKSERKTKT